MATFFMIPSVDWSMSSAAKVLEVFRQHDQDHYEPVRRITTAPGARTALLLILGSSPMVEGIPAFFAAGKYGIGLIVAMAVVFAISTIATYVLLCVYSTAGLQRVRLGSFERYGENPQKCVITEKRARTGCEAGAVCKNGGYAKMAFGRKHPVLRRSL